MASIDIDVQGAGIVAQVFVIANFVIALGYLFVPVLVLPYLQLRRRTVVAGAVFFIGCTGSHADMIYDVLVGRALHPPVGWGTTVWHVIQAAGTWGFILFFQQELRRADALVAEAQTIARETSEIVMTVRPDRSEELTATLAALRVQNTRDADAAMDRAVGKLPGRGEWVKAAPAVFMVCGTIIMIAIVTVFTVLAVTGTPTDAFFRLINLFFNALGAVGTLSLMTVALVHARRTLENRKIALSGQHEAHRAAEAASNAARGVNGELTRRVEEATRRAAAEVLREIEHERRAADNARESDNG